MGLSADCEAYVGRQILVEPQHGYGWRSHVVAPGTSHSAVEVPLRFHAIINRFYSVDGALMGGIGTIAEPGHALEGLRIAFAARHTIDRDFVHDPVVCNLTIGTEERVAENGQLFAVGAPALVGFGQLRDDAF